MLLLFNQIFFTHTHISILREREREKVKVGKKGVVIPFMVAWF